jgi:TonB-linked SusC/RagA family outer membrane protein
MSSHRRTSLCFLLALLVSSSGLTEAQGQGTGAVRGVVLQAGSGDPIPGAQVEIVGTPRGTISGQDGTFVIPGVPAGDRDVRVTYLGFGSVVRTANLLPGATVHLEFQLSLTVLDLDEIVVTGVAGEATRSKLAFTVERLTQAATPVQAKDASSLITGKVAGASVVQATGRPGTAPSILLRGPTSIHAVNRSQAPLIIVDGITLGWTVADIDASDVESIEIVKGAAAASLYGSRAANGVIQITTARGRNVAQDQIRYTLRTEYGANDLPGRFNLTRRHQFLVRDGKFIQQDGIPCDWLQCQSVSLAGQMALPGQTRNAWNTIQQEEWPGVTYDHVDRFFRNGGFLTTYMGMAGRSGSTNFNVSYNRQDDQGILPFHDGAQRHIFRVNVDQSIVSNLTVSASALYSRTRSSLNDGNIFQLTRMPAGVDLMAPEPTDPNTVIRKPDPFNDNLNPLYVMSTTKNHEIRGRYLGSVTARWIPRDWFNLEGSVSYERGEVMEEYFRPKPYYSAGFTRQEGYLQRYHVRYDGVNSSLTAQFRKRFRDLATTTHLRYLTEHDDYTFTDTWGNDFTATGVWTFNNIPSANKDTQSGSQFTRADGFFVITNLDFRDRYILDALIRQDGSSRFGPNERRHWYYRGSGAYRISEESWFNLPGVDEMKLRYSIGTAGNTPHFAAQYETYSVTATAITPVTLGNKNLKPEYATEQEMGLDLLLFGRVSLDLTYALSEVKDQILLVPALAYTGFANQWRNAGTLESNTFEATLNATLVRRSGFTWNSRLLFDRTRQEITELNVPAYQTGTADQGLGNNFYVRVGEAMGSFYGFQFASKCSHLPEGVDCSQFQVNDDGFLVWVGGAGSWKNGWQTKPEGGYWWGTTAPFTIRGANITWGTPFQAEGIDRVTGEVTTFLPLGTTTPTFNAGFANTLTWRGLTLYSLFRTVQGFKVYNQPLQWAIFQSYAGIMDQSGKPEELKKPIGYYDRLYGASGLRPSSAFVVDGSFIKLQELSMRYRAGRRALERLPFLGGMESVTFSVTGRNLLTWSSYDGYDPDVGETGGGPGSAVISRQDGYNSPNFRTVTFGLEIVF